MAQNTGFDIGEGAKRWDAHLKRYKNSRVYWATIIAIHENENFKKEGLVVDIPFQQVRNVVDSYLVGKDPTEKVDRESGELKRMQVIMKEIPGSVEERCWMSERMIECVFYSARIKDDWSTKVSKDKIKALMSGLGLAKELDEVYDDPKLNIFFHNYSTSFPDYFKAFVDSGMSLKEARVKSRDPEYVEVMSFVAEQKHLEYLSMMATNVNSSKSAEAQRALNFMLKALADKQKVQKDGQSNQDAMTGFMDKIQSLKGSVPDMTFDIEPDNESLSSVRYENS